MPENLESWLEWREAAERPVPGYVEDELRGYLECGLLCFGFTRAVCTTCRTGFVVAFSCKGRGVCPSCNGLQLANRIVGGQGGGAESKGYGHGNQQQGRRASLHGPERG